MTAIIDIIGREILDSRGNPTVEVDVDPRGRRAAAAPRCPPAPRPARMRRSSCATATRAAISARACARRSHAVNGEIFDAIGGMEAEEQARIDETLIALDGTPNKARLGANAILGVSLAVAKAAAAANRLPLYRYVGGTSARAPAGADDEHHQRRRARRQSDRLPGIHDHAGRRAELRRRRCAWASRSSRRSKKALQDAGHNTNVGDEGGFAPNLQSAEEALGFVMKAIEKAGYKPGEDVVLALDPASTEFFKRRRVCL